MKIVKALVALSLVGVIAWWARPTYGEPGLAVGQAAPDFSLQGSDGKTYTLSQFKGKKAVVIAWFPKAFTSGCTAECKSMRDSAEAIGSFDVAYFAASVDDAETNRKFAENLSLPFPILSDPTKATGRAYKVVRLLPIASRWTYYIGKDGKVLEIDRDVKTATAGEDLKKNLERLGIPKR